MVQEKNRKTLPFSIDFVIEQDLKNLNGYTFQSFKASNGSYDITCPFCNSKRKMNVNVRKNVAKCNKCGCGSGFNTITLHARLTGLSNKEAYKDLMNRWNGLGSDIKVKFENTISEEDHIGIIPAPIEIRDKVYRAFLAQLDLSDKHKNDLLKRGLTSNEIEKGMYKTVPVVGTYELAYNSIVKSNVLNILNEHKNWGIAGFTNVNDPFTMSVKARKSGFFIPVLTRDGKISGMQIRYDELPCDATEKEKEMYKKYSWFSSSEDENGCSVTGCENIHFAGDLKKLSNSICITEGVLKADIASFLSGKPFLGLVGVNNIGQLEDTLKKLNTSYNIDTVNIYVDMDYQKKKEVASALIGIKKTINKAGHHTYEITDKYPNSLYLSPFELNYEPKYTYRKGFKLSMIEGNLPNKMCIFLDNIVIPNEYWIKNGNSIEIEYEYINVIGNKEHTIRIVDISNGFSGYNNLNQEEKKALLKANLFGFITFNKTGLKYNSIVWDEKYKGIDDYLLYLKQINGK